VLCFLKLMAVNSLIMRIKVAGNIAATAKESEGIYELY